jgi:23S rRNA (guanosine2251-2'-O)-methyltransferase
VEDKKLIFGRNPVLEYLHGAETGSRMELFITNNAHGKIINAIIDEAEAKKITVRHMDKNFFAQIGSSSRHQGVVLKLHDRATVSGIDSDSLLEKSGKNKGLLVLLDQIADPHNAGSIIRTAEALGCSGIIMPKSHAAGITPAMVKASAGATAHIDIVLVGNVAAFLDEAKKRGFWIIGTDGSGTTELQNLGMVRPAILIIGSENTGMRRLTAEKCDFVVRIPLAGKISSLNASVAAGIVLYEIMKD